MSGSKKQKPTAASAADRRLFRESVGQVQPVSSHRARLSKPKPTADPRQTEASENGVIDELLTHPLEPAAMETGEEIYWLRSGIQRKVLQRLRRGHYRVEAELDLHQMNVEAARHSIDRFLQECQYEDVRCARIVHGKGLRSRARGPVLKQLTASLLRRRSAVLAYASAPPHDGGTGAVYVLIKR